MLPPNTSQPDYFAHPTLQPQAAPDYMRCHPEVSWAAMFLRLAEPRAPQKPSRITR